jgi:hypothetical protein
MKCAASGPYLDAPVTTMCPASLVAIAVLCVKRTRSVGPSPLPVPSRGTSCSQLAPPLLMLTLAGRLDSGEGGDTHRLFSAVGAGAMTC